MNSLVGAVMAQQGGGDAAAAFGGLICVMVMLLIQIPLLILWVWMLVDCVKNEPSEGNDKVVWILVLVFTGIIGAAIYYFVRRPQRISKFGK